MSKEPTKSESSLGVTMTGSPDDAHHITLDRDDALKNIFGAEHPEMAKGLLIHCLKVLKSAEASDDNGASDERMFMVSAIAEIKPRDATERMLAVQMTATHVAMIRSGSRLANADTLDRVNTHYNGYTKLARAYAMQMETLHKHRNGSKQVVTVPHVNVADGG